jgi:uncharacterized protein (TIGR00369 family)
MNAISDSSQGQVRLPLESVAGRPWLPPLTQAFRFHWLTLAVSGCQDWMNTLVPFLKIHSIGASKPHPPVTFSLTVQGAHCNNMQTLHGGCTATIFDICTTLALACVARPGCWDMLGVSRTLNITYMAPVRAGEQVLIACEIVQVGRNLATLRGIITKAEGGQIVATCEHGKYNAVRVQKM